LLQRKVAFILAPAFGQTIKLLLFRFSSDELFHQFAFEQLDVIKNLKHVLMKRILLLFGLLAVLMVTISSCVTMKRDCQGRKHYRTANGIYV